METLIIIAKIIAFILCSILGCYVKDFISRNVFGYNANRYNNKKKRYD